MRLFVAVSLPEEVINESLRIIETLKQEDLYANWVPKENLHITLLYLGEIADEELPLIKKALEQVKLIPFSANLTKAGVFSPDFIRVIWLGTQAREFVTLHVRVCEALKRNYKKDFVPHITLARAKAVRDKRAFMQKLSMLKIKPLKFNVDSFVLMNSNLTPDGPVYEEVLMFRV